LKQKTLVFWWGLFFVTPQIHHILTLKVKDYQKYSFLTVLIMKPY